MINQHYAAFIYVDSDIPAGMTLREWRRSRAPRFQRSFWDRVFRLPGRQIDLV
jgi:hypothetical protein